MTSIVLLKLKLTEYDADRLRRIGELCRHARCTAVEDWLLRQRGKPESIKQSGKGRNGDSKSESTKIYHAVTAAAPTLDTQVAAKIAGQISSHLSAKVDWRHGENEDGKRPRKRDEILSHNERPPFATKVNIEVPCSTAKVTFADSLLLSFVAIRGERDSVLISTKRLSKGHRKLIRRVINGDLKLSDSYLRARDGEWFWYLPISIPVEPLDSDNVAHLWPQIPEEEPDRVTDRPFRLELPNRTWFIGDGRYLLKQTVRLLGLLKMIGWPYRQGNGKGHGRKKFDVAASRRRKQLRDVVGEVRNRMIRDVVRWCERERCGSLMYHEPTLPMREKCWFVQRGLDWDWTRFASQLKNALGRIGMDVVVVKFKMADLKEVVKSCERHASSSRTQ